MKYVKYSAHAIQQKQFQNYLNNTYRANRHKNETQCWKWLC